MKNRFLIVFVFLTGYLQANIFDDFAGSVTRIFVPVHKKVFKPAIDATEEKVVKPTVKVANTVKSILEGEKLPPFCQNMPHLSYDDVNINSKKAMQDDYQSLLSLVQKYSPVLYLHPSENYYPMSGEEYFENPGTRVVNKANNKVVLDAGKITPESVYCLRDTAIAHERCKYVSINQEYDQLYKNKFTPGSPEAKELYFDIPSCVKRGSLPQNFMNNGNLTTPAYVIASEFGNSIYIQYMYFFGLNGPYTIKAPLLHIPVLAGDQFDFQNAHESDLEHITLEIDKTTKKLERVMFGAHGTGETRRIAVNDCNKTGNCKCNLQFEKLSEDETDANHIVAYVAKYGHGTYPEARTYRRIHGFADDITAKGLRWTPNYIPVYQEVDSRFDMKSVMGLLSHPGIYGIRGVSGLYQKDWFTHVLNEDTGPECGEIKGLPKDLWTVYKENRIEFSDTVIPPKHIGITPGTEISFNKNIPFTMKKNVQGVSDTVNQDSRALQFNAHGFYYLNFSFGEVTIRVR